MPSEDRVGMNELDVYTRIVTERERQNKLWGEQAHTDDAWLRIVIEELGEVASALRNDDHSGADRELVHVAAVVVAWMEDRDKQ